MLIMSEARLRAWRHRPIPAVVAPLASLVAAGAVSALLAVINPTDPRFFVTCPFLAVTGHYCPGCGSVRAMDALLRGDVGDAVGFNPLTVAAVPLVAALWVGWVRRSVTGAARRWAAPRWALWLLVGVVVLFWLLRNLPVGAALAP
jgi:Protein of unknown function (DUF2752)